MARMTKRISENIEKNHPQKQNQPKKKGTKVLSVLIVVNFLLMLLSYPVLFEEPTTFVTYILLEVILIIMYITRKEKYGPQVNKNLLKIQVFCMSMIFVLFMFHIYINYIK